MLAQTRPTRRAPKGRAAGRDPRDGDGDGKISPGPGQPDETPVGAKPATATGRKPTRAASLESQARQLDASTAALPGPQAVIAHRQANELRRQARSGGKASPRREPDAATSSARDTGGVVDRGQFMTEHDPLAAEGQRVLDEVLRVRDEARAAAVARVEAAYAKVRDSDAAYLKARMDGDRETANRIYDETERLREDAKWAERDITRLTKEDRNKAYAVLRSSAAGRFAIEKTKLRKNSSDWTEEADTERFRAEYFLETVTDAAAAPKVVAAMGGARTRAYALDDKYVVSPRSSAGTHVHEVGHLFESQSGAHLRAAVAFRDRRAEAAGHTVDRPVPLNQLRNGTYAGYAGDEVTLEDHFSEPYTGKVYRDASGRDDGTEITSMGLQYLYEDPVAFAERDPDHFRFTIAQLRRPKGK